MSVIKAKQKPTQYEPYIKAIQLRRDLTKLMLKDFGYKPKPVPEYFKNGKKKSPKQYNSDCEKRQKEEEFFFWFCDNERDFIIELMRKLSHYIQMTISIGKPQSQRELNDKLSYYNKVIGTLESLYNELQYIIETLPVDINKYIIYSDSIDLLIDIFSKEKQYNQETYCYPEK